MKTIKVEIKNDIAQVTLNRPEVRNAFNDEMIDEMRTTFSSLHTNKNIRAVVLRGAGESFCAGGDLNWMKSMVSYSHEDNIKDSVKLFDMYQLLQNIPVPVLSLVHGHAMGGALGLVAASDIVFAVEETKMSFSEVRLGLAPAVISSFVKNKILPRDMSRYFLTAEVFGPKEAYEMGLIHDYGSTAAMNDLAIHVAQKITNNGPHAVRETKKLIKNLQQENDVKSMTTELIAKLRVGSEGQEGLSAFFEKRKPSWVEPSNG